MLAVAVWGTSMRGGDRAAARADRCPVPPPAGLKSLTFSTADNNTHTFRLPWLFDPTLAAISDAFYEIYGRLTPGDDALLDRAALLVRAQVPSAGALDGVVVATRTRREERMEDL